MRNETGTHRMGARQARPGAWRLGLVVAISLVFVAMPVTATAGNGDGGGRVARLVAQLMAAEDPSAAFEQLSASDQRAVQDAVTVASVETRLGAPGSGGTDGEISIAAAGCWTWTGRRDGRNALGGLLWSYFQRIYWCGNGTVVTTVERTRWGEVYAPFWSWKHIGNQTWGGVNQATYRAWTQAEFKLCLIPDVGCVQYSYPWLDMKVWGNGNWWGDGGG